MERRLEADLGVAEEPRDVAGDIPLHVRVDPEPHTTTASSPNVRMPNQSSAPEKPRFSESTSSAASSASGTSSGSALREPRLGHHEQAREDDDREHARHDDARLAQAAVEAAPAHPERATAASGSDGHANQSRLRR